MKKNQEKPSPSPEAKALSLFYMAYKTKSPVYKENLKHINKQWDLVLINKLSKSDYNEEVSKILTSLGGYSAVVEKTVRFYIEKTGEWQLQGNDKYCTDAKLIADKLLSK